MPTRERSIASRLLALAVLLASTLALSAQPSGVEPLKKLEPAKGEPKDPRPLMVKLPDGTFLWLGPGEGERVTLTPQEYQKLLDRAEALKKELAARKPTSPSGCAVRGTVQKRGEQLVAVLKLTYSFRTVQASAAVALGGKKAFLVSAALDGAKLPVLDTGEDGFAVMVETAGDHTLVLDVEAPVTARGAKAEVGFDLGLPKAPITTLALGAPPGDVKRITLSTRTPDPAQPTKADTRRLAGLDVKQLGGPGAGLPLGPVDLLEVTWDPPAAGAQPADQVQSAEIDVSAVLTDGFVESTAKVKLRGPGREWKFVAPTTADVSVDRGTAPGDPGPTQQPTVTKPTDPAKVVWKVEFPVGSPASDWVVTAVVRQPRPKSGSKSVAVSVGPFAVLDVLKQGGTVRVTAGPHTRFVFKHGPDLRRAEVPGADDDTNSVALFRLATGPTGPTAVNAPLLTVEAWPVEGAVRVRPTYKLELTDVGWHVTMELVVKPIRTEIDTLTIDVPVDWRGLESRSEKSDELVAGISQGKPEGPWVPVTVRLAAGLKQPFTVTLGATVAVPPGARKAEVALPRFPKVLERDVSVVATVPEGLEVRGTARAWDGDVPAAWGAVLTPVPGPDGKVPRAVSSVTGKGERGLARLSLTWGLYRPDVSAEVRADVTVGEHQVVVSQVIKLRALDGFPRPVRFHGPTGAWGLSAKPPLDAPVAGSWTFAPPAEAKAATLELSFSLPLPLPADGAVLLWPSEAARTDAHVRVWVNSVTGRTVSTSSSGWRERAPELAPERDALPALTLAASAEHPLVLEVRSVAPEPVAAVEVRRALIEAGATADGSTGYRARFRLERWLAPSVEVWLPDAAGTVTATVEGRSAGLDPVGAGDGGKRFRVVLPEGAPGRTVVLELQYTLPGAVGAFSERTYVPPRLTGATYLSTRWLVTEPADAAPLVLCGGRVDVRWRARGVTWAPSAATRAALDRWFVFGTEPDEMAVGTEGEPVVLHQIAPESVRVARAPWLVLLTGCSLVVALVIFGLAWLPTTVAGLLIAILGGAFGAGAVLYPQPAAQVAAASQPGAVFGLVAVALLALVRRHARRSALHLPGFSRTPTEPSAPGPATSSASPSPAAASSGRSRPGSTGTAGAAVPAAPSGS
jgi:hypothetical protein